MLNWISKNPRDFTDYPQISQQEIRRNLKAYENANRFFYETLKKFHELKKEEKEKKRVFQREYKKILEEIKKFYKEDKGKVEEFKVGKRGILLDEKLLKLRKTFKEREGELQGKIRYSLDDVDSLLNNFTDMKEDISKIQVDILKSRKIRSKTFEEIRIFARKCRHVILARYAGVPSKKKAFMSM